MKKWVLLNLFLILFGLRLSAQDDIVGFWKTIDEKSGKAQSIMAVYEYHHKYYGRIIATYDDSGKLSDTIYSPKDRAPGVEGEPYYAGMDIIWHLKKKDDKYLDGEILDPEQGKVYDAELWVEDGQLVVRGKILFFGRNQKWPPVDDSELAGDFKKPDLEKMVPAIPKVKKR